VLLIDNQLEVSILCPHVYADFFSDNQCCLSSCNISFYIAIKAFITQKNTTVIGKIAEYNENSLSVWISSLRVRSITPTVQHFVPIPQIIGP
jgi:hypothetical protein